MLSQENSSGSPLASANWLEIHHRAKLPERIAFAKRLSEYKPKSIVDLGCASGLWLELLNRFMPDNCIFIGIDNDYESLCFAKNKSKSWNRKSTFIQMDIEKEAHKIPSGDMTLAFNVFPYIHDLDTFLNTLYFRNPKGMLVVRQYDGASIRFGPMLTTERQNMEANLRVAIENSKKFHHYDLDRTFNSLHKLGYVNTSYEFELFSRTSLFPDDFIPYYIETLKWTSNHISDASAEYLEKWINEDTKMIKRYFYEVDLIALLS